MRIETKEITETEARTIMRDHKIERGMEDPRSCTKIIQDLGLIPVCNEIEIIKVNEQQRLDQVYNLTANVQSVRAPYFAG